MLNAVNSYSYSNNVVSFRGRPRCNIRKCKADCCYNAPIPAYLLDKYKDKIVNPVIKQIPMCNLPDQGGLQVIPLTGFVKFLKSKCPFLKNDLKCNIYENRPLICKEYGTSKDPKSTAFCNLTV